MKYRKPPFETIDIKKKIAIIDSDKGKYRMELKYNSRKKMYSIGTDPCYSLVYELVSRNDSLFFLDAIDSTFFYLKKVVIKDCREHSHL